MKIPFKAAAIAFFLPGFLGSAAWAQTAVTPAGSTTQVASSYMLKHRSAYGGPAAHNPFYPIGWVKGVERTAQAVVEGPSAIIGPSSFAISSISIASTPLAVINGKTCAEGETIEARYGAQILKIKILQINDGSVLMGYDGKTFTVELKHPTLSSESGPPKELPPENPPMILH